MFIPLSRRRFAGGRHCRPAAVARLLLPFVILTLAVVAGREAAAQGNVYTPPWSTVGYIGFNFAQGDNWFGDPLFAVPADPSYNLLDVILASGVPDGTTVKMWDPIAGAYTTPSVFSSAMGWSIDYNLAPGDGAVLNAPSAFNVDFVGLVSQDFLDFIWTAGNSESNWTPPAINTPGTYLFSCENPIDQATFQQVVGRNPLDGESVRQWNAASQTSSVTTYEDGAWTNGAPALAVSEAAYFTLVPEPSALVLLGGAIAGLLGCAWRRRWA